MDGLLGVAGMMTLLVMTGIIPENSLRKTHQDSMIVGNFFYFSWPYLGTSQLSDDSTDAMPRRQKCWEDRAMDEPFRTVSGPALTGHHGTKRLNVYTVHSVPQVWTCLLNPHKFDPVMFDFWCSGDDIRSFDGYDMFFKMFNHHFRLWNHHISLLKSPGFTT